MCVCVCARALLHATTRTHAHAHTHIHTRHTRSHLRLRPLLTHMHLALTAPTLCPGTLCVGCSDRRMLLSQRRFLILPPQPQPLWRRYDECHHDRHVHGLRIVLVLLLPLLTGMRGTYLSMRERLVVFMFDSTQFTRTSARARTHTHTHTHAHTCEP